MRAAGWPGIDSVISRLRRPPFCPTGHVLCHTMMHVVGQYNVLGTRWPGRTIKAQESGGWERQDPPRPVAEVGMPKKVEPELAVRRLAAG